MFSRLNSPSNFSVLQFSYSAFLSGLSKENSPFSLNFNSQKKKNENFNFDHWIASSVLYLGNISRKHFLFISHSPTDINES